MEDNNLEIQIFKTKRLLKKIQNAKPIGSVLTLIIPPKKNINQYTNKLIQQMGKTSNIKQRITKQTALDAQTWARQRLKLYKCIPNNGLCIFTGQVIQEDGKGQKKLMIDFQPFRPISFFLYDCSFNFATVQLKAQLNANQPPYGFIIVDGNGTLYATLQGNTKQIILKFSVELPKKHRRGGQSSVRFARLRVQKRAVYLKKVCQNATQCFITDNKVNVDGLILAGSADFKNELQETQNLDPRLKNKVISSLDICYGGQNGLNQAIELSQAILKNVKYMKQKNIISSFFEQIATDSKQVVYGVSDTMKMFESGTVQKLLCYQNLQHYRVQLRNPETNANHYKILLPKQLTNIKVNTYKQGNIQFQVKDQMLLIDWLVLNYKNQGSQLIFLTDKSEQGTQFVKGFGGLAGYLRYKMDLNQILYNDHLSEDKQDNLQQDFI